MLLGVQSLECRIVMLDAFTVAATAFITSDAGTAKKVPSVTIPLSSLSTPLNDQFSAMGKKNTVSIYISLFILIVSTSGVGMALHI